MPTLYEIDGNMTALTAIMQEAGGEVTDEAIEAAVDQWLAENEKDLSDKLDGYGMVIRNFEANAAARKAEAARLSALATTDENNVKRLKERLRLFFIAHDIQKTESLKFKWAIQANGGKTPLQLSEEVNMDPLVLPSKYVEEVTEYKVQTDAIRQALETGTDEEKAELEGLAQLGEKGSHLRIR